MIKISKYIYIILFVSVMCFYISFILKELIYNDKYKMLYYISLEGYQGIIIEKYIDSKNHLAKAIKINYKSDTIIQYFTLDNSGFYDYVSVDDSVDKKKYSKKITVFKKNLTKKTFTLN